MSDLALSVNEFRRDLVDLLARATPFSDSNVEPDDLPDDLPDAGLPIACVVVVEWQAADGTRWLSRLGVLGNGDEAPRWTVEMLCREGLHWDEHSTRPGRE